MILLSRLSLLTRAPETRPRLTLNGLLAGFLVGNRLLAALSISIAAAALVPSAAAGVVTITLTDTRNDGTTTTNDSTNVSAGVFRTISNWLGLGLGDLTIFNGSSGIWSFTGQGGLELSFSNSSGDPTLFAAGGVVDATDFTNNSGVLFFRQATSTRAAFSPNTYLDFRNYAIGGANLAYRYGYLGVSWDGNGALAITSGAYEVVAGVAITIPSGGGGGGGSSSVPDSSSTGLMGLLFAGAAVRQWRKSRR